jgi:hypothetical protein
MFMRGTVRQVKSLPVISPENTKKMLILHKLYSTQRYHDVQILYFFTKNDGSYTHAAIELGCAPMTMWLRVRQLDREFNGLILLFFKKFQRIKETRIDARVSDLQVRDALSKTRSQRAAAKLLGISKSAVFQRAKKLGIKSKMGRRKK